MNSMPRQAFNAEMTAAIGLYGKREFAKAFRHLEIAHVLGQQYVAPHVTTHYWMLKVGVKRRSLPQVWGQVVRIVLGALGSAVGIVPVGNTGGTNIGMFKQLPVDPSVRELIEQGWAFAAKSEWPDIAVASIIAVPGLATRDLLGRSRVNMRSLTTSLS